MKMEKCIAFPLYARQVPLADEIFRHLDKIKKVE